MTVKPQSQPNSALPWHVFEGGVNNYQWPGIEASNDTSIVVWGDGDYADDCGVHGETPEQARANAELIVKAVNNHDALVKALKGIADFCSADAITLGAISRLTAIRNTALNVLAAVEAKS
jgi:hypothetical protein